MKLQSLSKPVNQRSLTLIVTCTIISGVMLFYGIFQEKQAEPKSSTVTRTEALPVKQVTALGRLEPATEVIQVSVPTSLNNDRVDELLVERSDQVEVGQVIAIMGSRDPLQSRLFEAQARVKVAQAELARVKAGATSGRIAAQEAETGRLEEELQSEIDTQNATVVRWQAEVRKANADYSRYLSLYQDGAIADSDLDQRRLALETTQAQLDEAKAEQNKSLDTLQQQIKKARATLDDIAEVRPVDVQAAQAEIERAIATVKAAEVELNETYIRAPIAGRILDIDVRPGEVVGEKGIADLGQTNQMEVVAEIYQTDIDKVREGQNALITSDLFSEQLRGTVHLVGLQVIQQEVTSGEPGENLDRKVIQVRIRLNPKDSQRVANLTNLQVQVAIQISISSM